MTLGFAEKERSDEQRAPALSNQRLAPKANREGGLKAWSLAPLLAVGDNERRERGGRDRGKSRV